MAEKVIQIADKPTLDEVKALLENSGYGLEAIKDAIGSGGSSGGGGIKSVQYGSGALTYMTSSIDDNSTITHDQVNVSKSFVLLNWTASQGVSSSQTGFYQGIILERRTDSSFTIKRYAPSNSSIIKYSWQLIEFE